MKSFAAYFTAGALVLSLAACSPSEPESQSIILPAEDTAAEATEPTAPIEGPAVVEQEYDKNKADAMFVSMMIPHHYQGIEMNVIAGRNTSNPDILTLSSNQTSTHEGELAIMEQYFWDWSLPYYEGAVSAEGASLQRPTPKEEPKFILVHGGDGVDHIGNEYLVDENPIYQEGYEPLNMRLMEGMLSDTEMIALFNATDAEFDRLWLQGMIMHHAGAITMAERHQANGIHPILLELSQQIIDTQTSELELMNSMLATLEE